MHSAARQLPIRHLSVRLPWHDSGWTGSVCSAPSKNSWCMILKGIRKERKDAAEEAVAGRAWSDLGKAELPACLTERGAALNAKAYSICRRHPFAVSSVETHGHFDETELRLPPYSLQTIPFRWTRKEDAQAIADELSLPFDLAREPQLAFETVWVNDFVNQQIMLDTFFSALAPEKSLVFLYAKRTPLTDDTRRVLVGVGRITSVGSAQEHERSDHSAGRLQALMWERAVSHSIRPDGFDGFVLPYQELLALAERDGTIDPSDFVALAPEEGFEAFSNAAEHVDHDLAIASLLSLADKVRVIAKHIPGAWDSHLEWISERLSELWQLRGAFPGLGSALHAFEIRYGTLIAMDLAQRYCVDGQWKEDPWTLVSRAFEDPTGALSPQVASQVQPFDGTRLSALPDERLEHLKLLSRFNLTVEQASRFFNTENRDGLTDEEILGNPFRLFETDKHRLDGTSGEAKAVFCNHPTDFQGFSNPATAGQPVSLMGTFWSGFTPSSWKARFWTGVGAVTTHSRVSSWPGRRTWFSAMPERSSSRVRKLWTGSPSGVLLSAALAFARSETSAFSTGELRCARAPSRSSSSNRSGARRRRMCHSTCRASMHRNTCART